MFAHVVLLYLLALASAFEIGFSPKHYKNGDKVELLLNKVESDHTQLPFRYNNLPFVCYDRTKRAKSLLLGEILRGDRFWESNYELHFGVDKPCTRLCDMSATENGISRADNLIRNGYVIHWQLDGLPGATTFVSANHNSKYYAAGFPLGFLKDDTTYLYNHVVLVIRYHTEKDGQHSIVGFEVYPKSVNNEVCPGSSKKYKNLPLSLPRDKGGKLVQKKTRIPYTYAVYWREDNSVTYENRWDLYYENDNSASSNHIQWLSLINLLVLVCLVTLVVAIAIIRLLKTDLQSGPTIPLTKADIDADMGGSGQWKNLVNVVMQRPAHVLILSTLTASGVQFLVALVGVVLIFVLNSKLSPGSGSSSTFFNNHQGAFFTCSVVLLLASGFVSGFVGIIVDKILNNEHPNTLFNARRTRKLSCFFAGALPLTILCVVLFLNLFVWAKESSSALPFGTILVLILLYSMIELPLGMLGGDLGNRFKFSAQSFIVTSYIPDDKGAKKHIRKSFVMSSVVSVLAFGLIPFGIVYVDLLFIFNSVWLEKTTFYYMYGFLLLTTLILLIVIAESAILATYLSLTLYNNPNWQWLCFRVGSSIGWYIYAYSIYYFMWYLHMSDFVSILLYFSYMALVSAAVGIGCGAVAVLAAIVFIRRIYGVVKVD